MLNDRFSQCGVIPVVVLDKEEDAVPLAKALLDGGIDVAEITFRTKAAENSIRKISKEVPEMFVGAGTIINLEQLNRAINAGAKFIVSPSYDEEIVSKCQSLNITVFPGVITPTEIMKAIKQDLEVVKFFPSESYGGLKTIQALSGPFTNLKFMPTGGISKDNLAEYLEPKKIHAVGGSWICDKKLILNKDWNKITELCKEAMEIFKKVRK